MNILRILLLLLATTATAVAGPGAHGPNGEHLDTPGGHAHGDAGPRIEAATESFELVGRLQGGELSILVDRFETNEPVLNGTLEVEYKGMKAPARFHADNGDYAVDDPKFLAALAKPGRHALIFTLTAAGESDLLEGVLEVAAADEHAGEHGSWLRRHWKWLAGAAVALALAAAVHQARRGRLARGA